MILTSSIYLTFLIILLFLYYTFPKKIQWLCLFVFSFLFIVTSTSDVKVYAYIIYGILVTYLGAKFIKMAKTDKSKKIIEVITIILILLQLIYLKYLNFFGNTATNILNMFGKNNSLVIISIVAPIGVSFYTLISLGYVIDVARGVVEPQKNILKYSLYILYFPQITSGPITRYSEMENSLFKEHQFKLNNILFGFQRILWGIFKKLVISERVAIITNTIFNNYTDYNGVYILIGVIAFAIQLYTDFSGCMDIVIGTSETLDIKLPENFNTPFFSKSISEYWRRWHITLGTWFKDYLFYPILKSNLFQNMQDKLKKKLGKKWGKRIPTYLGMLILWFTVGAWHGGACTYIIGSGLLHWFYIVSGEILNPAFNKLGNFLKVNKERLAYKIWQMIRTSTLVCIGFVFFRSESVFQAIYMLRSIFVNNFYKLFMGEIQSLGLNNNDITICLLGTFTLFIVSLLKQKYEIREEISKQHIIIRYSIWICLILCILILGYYGKGYDASSFIYQKF